MLPEGQPARVVHAAGVPSAETVAELPLHAVDQAAVDHLTSVFLPASSALGAPRSFPTLLRLVAQLRAPGGCPWDRAQTTTSLRDAVLNEAYEVVDAIDAADGANLAEELGDLLLLVVMHAQIANEAGDFSLADVLEAVNTKLVRRHPHVFGEAVADTAADVVVTWNEVKAAERRMAGAPPKPDDPLERLPRSMPALERAARVVRDAARDEPMLGRATEAETDPSRPGGAGGRLLAAVEDAVRAGVAPEAALLSALRARYGRPGDRVPSGSASPTAAP